jgi:lipopolysaccharide export LptBFGC system permease protein LptF
MKKIYKMIFILCLVFSLQGQTADEFWHPAANLYANAKFQQAMGEVENGLNLYPNDPKLNALAEKIKEQQEQQQQQQQNQEEQQSQGEEQETNDQQEQQQEQQQEEQDQQLSQAEQEDQEQMSKEDAERILDALKNDEQENQKLRKQIKGGQRTTDKDW